VGSSLSISVGVGGAWPRGVSIGVVMCFVLVDSVRKYVSVRKKECI
jgi:hypothetical protein